MGDDRDEDQQLDDDDVDDEGLADADNDDESVHDDEDDLINKNTEDVVDDLKYDVFNLVACNHHTIRIDSDSNENIEDVIVSHTQRAVQLLLKK